MWNWMENKKKDGCNNSDPPYIILWFGHRLVVLTNCPTSSLRKSHLVFTSDIHNLKMDGHFTSHAWPTKPWISDDSAWSNPLKKTESITTEKKYSQYKLLLLYTTYIHIQLSALKLFFQISSKKSCERQFLKWNGHLWQVFWQFFVHLFWIQFNKIAFHWTTATWKTNVW